MQCLNCKSKLWQEQSIMRDTKNLDQNGNQKKTMIDNWHCKDCGSVFTDSEIKKNDIDPKTGKVSDYHLDNCSGCSLCTPTEAEKLGAYQDGEGNWIV